MNEDKIPTFALMVLSQDVQNPRPDKRHKYDWTKVEQWRKGTKFEIERLGDVEIIRHVKKGLPSSRSMSATRHPEAFATLRSRLVPAPVPAAKAPTITIEEAERLVQEAWQLRASNNETRIGYSIGLVELRDEILAQIGRASCRERV